MESGKAPNAEAIPWPDNPYPIHIKRGVGKEEHSEGSTLPVYLLTEL